MAGPFYMDAGKAITTNRLIGAGTEPKYVAIGTGAGPANSAATALSTEVETRDGTNGGTRSTSSVTNDKVSWTNTISITGTRAITEVGLFDASSTGNMFIGSGISVINLVSGDSIQLTFSIVFS